MAIGKHYLGIARHRLLVLAILRIRKRGTTSFNTVDASRIRIRSPSFFIKVEFSNTISTQTRSNKDQRATALIYSNKTMSLCPKTSCSNPSLSAVMYLVRPRRNISRI